MEHLPRWAAARMIHLYIYTSNTTETICIYVGYIYNKTENSVSSPTGPPTTPSSLICHATFMLSAAGYRDLYRRSTR